MQLKKLIHMMKAKVMTNRKWEWRVHDVISEFNIKCVALQQQAQLVSAIAFTIQYLYNITTTLRAVVDNKKLVPPRIF